MKRFALILCLFSASVLYADSNRPPLKIQEEDGSPSGIPRTLKVSDDTLTDNGDGTFSLDTGGGAGSGDITAVTTGYGLVGGGTSGAVTIGLATNATAYIQNSELYQGATVYLSSISVRGEAAVHGELRLRNLASISRGIESPTSFLHFVGNSAEIAAPTANFVHNGNQAALQASSTGTVAAIVASNSGTGYGIQITKTSGSDGGGASFSVLHGTATSLFAYNGATALDVNTGDSNSRAAQITSTGTAPGLKITANGVHGTTAGTSGGILMNCTGGGALSGMCSQFYSNAGAQAALGGIVNVIADNTAYDQPAIYIKHDGTPGGAAQLRLDGVAPQIEFVENDQSSPVGKFEFGVNGGSAYIASRNGADSSFERVLSIFSIASGAPGLTLLSTGTLNFGDSFGSTIGFRAPTTLGATFTHDLWNTSSNVGLLLEQSSNSAPRGLRWSNSVGVSGSSLTFRGHVQAATMTVSGSGVGRVQLDDADASRYISLKASATITNNLDITLPAADGTAGQQLTTNGNNVWYWADGGSGGGSPSNGILLKDSDGDLWAVTISTAGSLTSTNLGAQSLDPEPILLVDSDANSWEVSISTAGNLTTTVVP